MKLGITSITFRTMKPPEIIRFSEMQSLDGIEWGGDVHVPPGNLKRAGQIGALTRSAGLQVCSYGSYYRLGCGMVIEPVLETAVALGTRRVRIWAGSEGSAAVSPEMRTNLIEETRVIAEKAKDHGIEFCFEYHRNTLTDTGASTSAFLAQIDRPNVHTYWQPNPEITHAARIAEIQVLKDEIKALHAFWWTGKNTRLPLIEGREAWRAYLAPFTGTDIPLLLEFCKDDNPDQAAEDLRVLASLLSH